MRSGFARLHPLVDLTFFVLVLAFAMFLSHPAVQLAGLVCAALFALRCTGRGFGRRMAMLLPLMLLAAVVNPLVSHQGVTVLFRFPSGNACTLESVLQDNQYYLEMCQKYHCPYILIENTYSIDLEKWIC